MFYCQKSRGCHTAFCVCNMLQIVNRESYLYFMLTETPNYIILGTHESQLILMLPSVQDLI